MAWVESYHCDVCGKARTEQASDWWLAWYDSVTPTADAEAQSVLKITPWNLFLSHDAAVKHICGGRCAQTFMDRWMQS